MSIISYPSIASVHGLPEASASTGLEHHAVMGLGQYSGACSLGIQYQLADN